MLSKKSRIFLRRLQRILNEEPILWPHRPLPIRGILGPEGVRGFCFDSKGLGFGLLKG